MSTPSAFPIFAEGIVANDPERALECLDAARKIANSWQITDEELCRLIRLAPSELKAWLMKERGIGWDRDQLERISILASIHHILMQLLGGTASVRQWLTFPQPSQPFNGQSPLATMLNGAMIDLYEVYHWLKCRTELCVT